MQDGAGTRVNARSAPSTSSGRDLSLDWLKGVLVIGVVLIHARALAGLSLRDPLGYVLLVVDGCLVPAFFTVSGYLAAHAIDRPWRAFLDGLLRRLIWPYLVWALIGALASVYLFEEWRPDRGVLLSFLVRPAAVTTAWYLHYLAVVSVVAKVLRRLPRGLVLSVLMLAALGAGLALGNVPSIVLSMVCYMIGLEISRFGLRERCSRGKGAHTALLVGVGALVAVLMVVPVFSTGVVPVRGWGVAVLLPLVAAVLLGASALWRAFGSAVIESCGRRSLEIYVCHFPAMGIVVAALRRTSTANAGTTFWLFTACGLTVATVLALLAGRSKMVSLLFTLPRERGPRAPLADVPRRTPRG